MEKVKKILRFGMRLEKQGETFYEYYKDRVKSDRTKELFEELAEMEREHYLLLEEKYNVINTKDELKVISWVVDDNQAFSSPMIFGEQADLMPDEEDVIISDLAIMRMAYLIESDFAEFYKNASKHVEEEEVKDFLLQLAKWETGHKEVFYNEYRQLLRKNWDDMDSYLALND